MTLTQYDDGIRAAKKVTFLCGVDEAGRGPLAGPVYAAAVILPPGLCPDGLADSKKLSQTKREKLFDEIISMAAASCVASASVEEIESLNILGAAMLAMRRATAGLSICPELVVADGNRPPGSAFPEQAIVKGDSLSACVAAASVLAKVARDRLMLELDERYPQYLFRQHKGYGTKLHYEMLDKYGPCPVHRQSFLKKWSSSTLTSQLL